MKEDLFRDIIIKFIKGDATPHEKMMLSNWLKENPDREETFYFHLSSHESESPQYVSEIQSKVDEYKRFLQGETENPAAGFDRYKTYGVSNTRTISNRVWWGAASFILVLAASFYFLHDSFFYRTYTAQNGMIRSVTLDDGSTVTLNANSSIKLFTDFLGDEYREVWIKGEAFFDVQRRRDRKKFIVHTDNFDVEVLGTKFNIKNRRCTSEVILAEGKVKLVAKDQKSLMMKPGEQVSLSNSQEHFHKQTAKPEKYEAWRNNMLVFENTPLAEVTQIIEDYYGVEMIVRDSLLRTREFTGSLPNDDLDVILVALGTAYKIKVERTGNQILLNNRTINYNPGSYDISGHLTNKCINHEQIRI